MSSDDAPAPGKRLAYTSKACSNCRRRKARCSGSRPCQVCQHFGEECSYSTGPDRRKASSTPYVSALELRVRQLEQSLAEASFSSSSASATPAAASAALHELQHRNEALRAKLLKIERALSSRGISISEVLEDEPSRAVDVSPTSAAIDIALPRKPSMLGKRLSDWGDESSLPDDDSSWVEGMRSLQATLNHAGEAETPVTSSATPISASLDFSPSPLSTPASLPPRSFDFDFPQSPPSSTKEDDLDWSRNLPQDLGISRQTHDDILDLFEAFFAPWCMVIDMPRFRQDMQLSLSRPFGPSQPPAPTRTDFYSPMLHNAVLALGCFLHKGDRVKPFPPVNLAASALKLYPQGTSTFFSPEFDTTKLPTSDLAAIAFYNHASAAMELEAECPMLSTVRALFLIASFNSSFARCNSGYLIAIRCAAALGVNIDSRNLVERRVITSDVRDARDRLFWTCFSQDALWSLALGRFVTFSTRDHEIDLPAASDEDDARPWLMPSVWDPGSASSIGQGLATRLVPTSTTPGYSSTCLLATSKLALIQSDIIKDLYSLNNELHSSRLMDVVSSINLRLEAWADELPPPLRLSHFLAGPPPPHIITLQLTFQNAVMLLHRPLFHHAEKTDAGVSVAICDKSAHKVVQLLELYDSLYGLGYAPLTSIQTTFVAGTVLLLLAKRSLRAPKRLRTSLDGAEFCCAALSKMGKTWSWANRTHGILRSLVRKWIPTDDSPSPTALSDLSFLPAAAPFLPAPTPPLATPLPAQEPQPGYARPPAVSFNPFLVTPFDRERSAGYPHPEAAAFDSNLGWDFSFANMSPIGHPSASTFSIPAGQGHGSTSFASFSDPSWLFEWASGAGLEQSEQGVEPYVS